MKNQESEEVGLILVSQKTWDKIKQEFPPPIKSIFPTMGFYKSIPVRISELVGDDKIVPLPKSFTDQFKDFKFHAPEFKVRIEQYIPSYF